MCISNKLYFLYDTLEINKILKINKYLHMINIPLKCDFSIQCKRIRLQNTMPCDDHSVHIVGGRDLDCRKILSLHDVPLPQKLQKKNVPN
jgi:hypothetical protein